MVLSPVPLRQLRRRFRREQRCQRQNVPLGGLPHGVGQLMVPLRLAQGQQKAGGLRRRLRGQALPDGPGHQLPADS